MTKSIERRALEWLLSGDTGSSSRAIVRHMFGVASGDVWSYPSDPGDLGRCLRLLELIPEWKPRIQEMASTGPGWAGQVAIWDDLASSMDTEVGIDWSKGKRAPETYRKMKMAQADGYRNDPEWECRFNQDGTLTTAQRKSGYVY